MAEGSSLKLIMEKGPREGETLTYTSRSLIKIGRVVRGNTIAIKDEGISSKHICIQFDNELNKWTICDLDSSNGTVLNGQMLKPYAPSNLHDGDCIKIGELTSITVKIGAESPVKPTRRNPRRVGKAESVAGGSIDVKKESKELGLGFEVNLGEIEVKEPVPKRNLRNRAKKGVDLKSEVEDLSFKSKLNQNPEVLNVDAIEGADGSVPVEPRRTRGRKKMPVQVSENPDLEKSKLEDNVVEIDGKKRTRGGRKGLRVERVVDESSNNSNESAQVDEGNEAAIGNLSESLLENVNVENSSLGKILETSHESAKEHVVDESLLMRKVDTDNESGQEHVDHVVDESLVKGKEVVEEAEGRKDGGEGVVEDGGVDNGQGIDLEKMTLLDFFNYLEVQLPKEIYEESEKIMADMREKARKCREFRAQRNKSGKGI